MDPFGLYEDARLWDALRRAYLIESPDAVTSNALAQKLEQRGSLEKDTTDINMGASTAVSGSTTPKARFTLDTVIESEGANLSVGERSLLSLARALVKDCKIVVLDEAT